MKEFLKTLLTTSLAVLLAIVVLLLVVAAGIAIATGGGPDVEDHSWLVVDLSSALPEYAPPTGLLEMVAGDSPETLQRVLGNLEKARVDERVDGVILKIDAGLGAGTAALGEIRGAVHKVRDGGKKAVAYTESLNRQIVYLAAACDEIYAPPSAYAAFTGFDTTSVHVLGALEKLGIRPNINKIKDYKSAAEMVTRKDMSESARENREWMIEEYWHDLLSVLQEDRGLAADKVVAVMERAVLSAAEAREAGLVDELLYWDQLKDKLAGGEQEEELETLSQETYAQVDREDLDLGGDKTVAVVHAQGMIGGRKSGVNPLLGVMMGYESVSADLRRAAEDEDVAAIVFRVDSRGGSGYASDVIGHTVESITADKPVVVSMVDAAASGGYKISYRASRILACPMTVTGSIGSISGKFNMSELYEKLGFSFDHVTKGPMATFYSDERDFTDEEWERFSENHWQSFNRWLADVAEHRQMTFEEAEQLAHGRVWTGRQAAANGLVDEVGGLDRAVEVAKELAGIAAEEPVSLVHYPVQKDPLELLMNGEEETRTAVGWLLHRFLYEDLVGTWQTLAQGELEWAEGVEVR